MMKEAAAWMGEKASRIKLGAGMSNDFETFEALEFLALGIQGKLHLWYALEVATVMDARLRYLDFKILIARANDHGFFVLPARMGLFNRLSSTWHSSRTSFTSPAEARPRSSSSTSNGRPRLSKRCSITQTE